MANSRLRRKRSDVANLARQDGEQNCEDNNETLAVLRHVFDASYPGCRCLGPVSVTSGTPITSSLEVSERLVGSPAFKAGGMGDPCPAGSIPVHLRHPLSRSGAGRGSGTLGVRCRVAGCVQACSSTNTRMSRPSTRSRYFV